jgi:hypothetical protein
MSKRKGRKKPGRKAEKYGKYEPKLHIPLPFEDAVRGLISVKVPTEKKRPKK